MVNPWNEADEPGNSRQVPRDIKMPASTSDEEEAEDFHLAYMSSASDISHQTVDQHVRFGVVNDIDREMEVRRQSEEQNRPEDQSALTSRAEFGGGWFLLFLFLLNVC
jgi:hypothetical protein